MCFATLSTPAASFLASFAPASPLALSAGGERAVAVPARPWSGLGCRSWRLEEGAFLSDAHASIAAWKKPASPAGFWHLSGRTPAERRSLGSAPTDMWYLSLHWNFTEGQSGLGGGAQRFLVRERGTTPSPCGRASLHHESERQKTMRRPENTVRPGMLVVTGPRMRSEMRAHVAALSKPHAGASGCRSWHRPQCCTGPQAPCRPSSTLLPHARRQLR